MVSDSTNRDFNSSDLGIIIEQSSHDVCNPGAYVARRLHTLKYLGCEKTPKKQLLPANF
jgi:hypothetical protein